MRHASRQASPGIRLPHTVDEWRKILDSLFSGRGGSSRGEDLRDSSSNNVATADAAERAQVLSLSVNRASSEIWAD